MQTLPAPTTFCIITIAIWCNFVVVVVVFTVAVVVTAEIVVVIVVHCLHQLYFAISPSPFGAILSLLLLLLLLSLLFMLLNYNETLKNS